MIGHRVHQGEIYSTSFRSGAMGSSSYTEIGEGWAPFKVVQNNKTMLDIWASGSGGMIQIYDSTDMRGQILPHNDSHGIGIRLTGRNLSGSPQAVSITGRNIEIASTEGTWVNGNATVIGDMNVTGRLTVSGQGHKNAIHRTKNYGDRYLYSRESPDERFIIEDVAKLENGECRIDIDSIFLETIEPHSVYKWSVHLTPYGDVSLFVKEMGENYIIAKEKDNGNSNTEFSWSLSGKRQGRLDTWIDERKIDEDGVLDNIEEFELVNVIVDRELDEINDFELEYGEV